MLIESTDLGFRNMLVAFCAGTPVHTLSVPFLSLIGIHVLPGDSSATLGARVQILNATSAVRLVVVDVKGATTELAVAAAAGKVLNMPQVIHGLDVLASNSGSTLVAVVSSVATSTASTTSIATTTTATIATTTTSTSSV